MGRLRKNSKGLQSHSSVFTQVVSAQRKLSKCSLNPIISLSFSQGFMLCCANLTYHNRTTAQSITQIWPWMDFQEWLNEKRNNMCTIFSQQILSSRLLVTVNDKQNIVLLIFYFITSTY